MSELTQKELFEITKYALNGCIQNLEDGLNRAKITLDSATTAEQLEQVKVLIALTFNSTIHEMNKITVQNPGKTK